MKVAKLPNTFVLFKSLLSGQMIVMISPRLRRKHERFKIIGGTLAGLLFVNHDVSTSSAFIIQPSLVSPGLTAMSDATAPWRAGKRSHLIMSTATSEITAQELLEPPKDDTFTVRGALNEFRTSVEASPQRARKFEVLGGKTGGIWRSRILGFLPATVLAAPVATSWLAKQEAVGKIVTTWPASTAAILGARSIANCGTLPQSEFEKLKDVYIEAIGPKAILSLKTLVEVRLEKYMARWRGYAERGEEVRLHSEISRFTLEVIATCVLGRENEDMNEIFFEEMPKVTAAVFSLPFRLPWPLRCTPLARLPPFNFGRGMDARDRILKVLQGYVEERRQALSAGGADVELKGMVDKMLEMQAKQRERGGPWGDEMPLDDAFIGDNVINALFAGRDTTSASLTRLVQLLATPDAAGLAENLLQEMNSTELEELGPEASGGLLSRFPLLLSTIFEQARLHPPVGGVFRRAEADLDYNGYSIRAGDSLLWHLLPGLKSPMLYPEPERFCPFRFLHADNGRGGTPTKATSSSSFGDGAPDLPGQSPPAMFGYGRHLCPGRDLAKLEMFLFLKTFLAEFDYRVVEGQDLSGQLPTNFPKSDLRVILSKKAPSSVLE